jgi:DNA-binding response OmpR family regulator
VGEAGVTKILLVEDDPDVATMIGTALKEQRIELDAVADGDKGFEYVCQGHYDVIILDWHVPGLSGVEICRRFREMQGTTPILMLTGKTHPKEIEQGLDAGADDYLKKPFIMSELLARLRALSRRSGTSVSSVLTIANIELDPGKHKVTKDGREVHLLPKDFSLLEFFMRNPDQIFSAETLLRRVWDLDADASTESLRTAVSRIRKVIDSSVDEGDSLIENVRRVGYRLKPQ